MYVIFLSSSERVSLLKRITPIVQSSSEITQRGLVKSCIPFGEKCFHPQEGLVDKSQKYKATSFKLKKEIEDKEQRNFSDVEGNVGALEFKSLESEKEAELKCKESHFFDIYCGKANKKVLKGPSKFEIWIDTSTSMRNSDHNLIVKKDSHSKCYRQDFIKRLRSKCSPLMVYQYAKSKKQVGSTGTLCENHEQNSERNLLRWIKNSKAKSLVLVTDTDSMSLDLGNLLDSLGAKQVGIEDRIIGGVHLEGLVPEVAKMCQKFSK